MTFKVMDEDPNVLNGRAGRFLGETTIKMPQDRWHKISPGVKSALIKRGKRMRRRNIGILWLGREDGAE